MGAAPRRAGHRTVLIVGLVLLLTATDWTYQRIGGHRNRRRTPAVAEGRAAR